MLKGYRTVIFNVVMGVMMLVHAINPEAVLPEGVAVENAIDTVDVALTALWTVGNLVLRAITDSPIFKKWSD